jgi:hypothetical protein
MRLLGWQIIFCCILCISACFSQSKEKKYCTLVLHLEHRFGGEAFRLNQTYQTNLGDSVSFTKLMYYLSNISLISSKNKHWSEKESYRLIKIDSSQNHRITLKIDSIPTDKYQKLSFGIGIDSVRNHSGAQIADLDPLQGMFWTWEQGYVFFKAEGYFFPPKADKGAFVCHIGRNSTYRTLTFDISPEHKSQAEQIEWVIQADVKALFGGYPQAKIDLKMPTAKRALSIMGGERALKLADNLVQLFTQKR